MHGLADAVFQVMQRHRRIVPDIPLDNLVNGFCGRIGKGNVSECNNFGDIGRAMALEVGFHRYSMVFTSSIRYQECTGLRRVMPPDGLQTFG